jgi:YbgC/YbaW family acyl-CoA thioester hydrolase
VADTGRTSKLELRVRWGETDAAGIVFYPNYYAWFDVATFELLRNGGQREGFGFPLIESGARFHAPLFPDELMTIESVVTEVRTKAIRIDHTVRRNGKLIAAGFEARVFAKLLGAGIEATMIPDDLRTWLQQAS